MKYVKEFRVVGDSKKELPKEEKKELEKERKLSRYEHTLMLNIEIVKNS
jgi:hypothetical protein